MRNRCTEPNCPLCYEGRKGRRTSKGHWGYRPPKGPKRMKPWEEAAMKRPGNGAGENGDTTPGRGELFANLPELWNYLTESKWDDGANRERATLLLLMDGSIAKAWLNDRATGRALWTSGETVEAALASMEEALTTGIAAWRIGESRRNGKSRT